MDKTRHDGLARRLPRYRRQAYISQLKLSHLSGVSLSLIQRIEQAGKINLRLNNLRRLAAALNVPLSDLLGDDAGPLESDDDDAGGDEHEDAVTNNEPNPLLS